MSLVGSTRMMTLLTALEGPDNKIQGLSATARRVHLGLGFVSRALRIQPIQPIRPLRQEEESVLERREAAGWSAFGRTNGSPGGPVNGRING
jgi:hypothetical protein